MRGGRVSDAGTSIGLRWYCELFPGSLSATQSLGSGQSYAWCLSFFPDCNCSSLLFILYLTVLSVSSHLGSLVGLVPRFLLRGITVSTAPCSAYCALCHAWPFNFPASLMSVCHWDVAVTGGIVRSITSVTCDHSYALANLMSCRWPGRRWFDDRSSFTIGLVPMAYTIILVPNLVLAVRGIFLLPQLYIKVLITQEVNLKTSMSEADAE